MALPMKPLPRRPELEAALKASAKAWDKMTDAQKEAMIQEQRKSWARQDMD